MEEWHAIDRRKFVRFPVSIILKCQGAAACAKSASRTHDISIKGVGIVTSEQFELGSCVNMFLTMPDNGEEIQATGKVIWEDRNGKDTSKFRLGIFLEEANLKPIPLVLRTMQAGRQ